MYSAEEGMRRRPRSGGFQPPTVETISVETTYLVKSQTSGGGFNPRSEVHAIRRQELTTDGQRGL